jgi:hypothetical protein
MGIEGAADVRDPRSGAGGYGRVGAQPGRRGWLGVQQQRDRASAWLGVHWVAVGHSGGSSDIGESHRARLGS